MDALGYTTRVDTDFTSEYLNDTESDCAADDDPTVKNEAPVGASGIKTADFKVEGSSLALVIDETASMGPEIGAIKTGLQAMIDGLAGRRRQLPEDDDRHVRRPVAAPDDTRDPDRLLDDHRHAQSAQHAGLPGGVQPRADDRRAAARLRRAGDPRDRRRQPPRAARHGSAVEDFYRAKGLRLNTMLSGSCPAERRTRRCAGARSRARSRRRR